MQLDGCNDATERFVGVCGDTYNTGTQGCCVPITSTATGPIVSRSIPESSCEGSVASGGSGGVCRTRAVPWSNGCSDSTESFIGLCRTTLLTNADGCCVPTGSAGDTSLSLITVTSPGYLNYQLLEQIPGSDNTVGNFNTYLQDIYRFAFWAIGIAVVFMLTIGGFMYLTSAGNTSRMESAKTIIFDAILGLILALVAWLFLYMINPDFVNLSLPTVSIATVPAPAAGTTTGTGTSTGSVTGTWATPAQLAQQIRLSGSGIRLSSSGSCSGTAGAISPTLSMSQAATNQPVTRCQNGCPGTGLCTQTTGLSANMLSGLLSVAATYPFMVTSFTGGSHAPNSAHYQGRAVDIVPDAPKAQWPLVQSALRGAGVGATNVLCDITVNRVTVYVSCDDSRADHIHAEW